MLDLNNLLQNSSGSIESFVTAQDADKIAGISTTKDELQDKEDEVDSGSFVVLMSEIVSNNLIKDKINFKESDESEDYLIDTNSDSNGSKGKSSDDLALLDTQDNDADKEQLVTSENNVALAWIESERFNPYEGVADFDGMNPDDVALTNEPKPMYKLEFISSAANNSTTEFDGDSAALQPAAIMEPVNDVSFELNQEQFNSTSENQLSINANPGLDMPDEDVQSVVIAEQTQQLSPLNAEKIEETPALLAKTGENGLNIKASLKNAIQGEDLPNAIQVRDEAPDTDLIADQQGYSQREVNEMKQSLVQEMKASDSDKHQNIEIQFSGGNQSASPMNTLVNANTALPGQAAEPETVTTEIAVDINNAQWAEQFSERMVWLGNQNVKSAQIKIHPENLGPLEINIEVIKDAASVNIISHNTQVRDVVEQALPRLREMMADQGLTLSDVHVGTGGESEQFKRQHSEQSELIPVMEEAVSFLPAKSKKNQGLIDYFA